MDIITTGRAHARFAIEKPLTRTTEWLRFVKQCNAARPTMFGSPQQVGPWWAGGTVEEYPDARIIRRDDESMSIVAKTDAGDRAMREAAAQLSIHIS